MEILKVDGKDVSFKMIDIPYGERRLRLARPDKTILPGQSVYYCISNYGYYYYRYFMAMRRMEYVK